jgi:hypothetical protein
MRFEYAVMMALCLTIATVRPALADTYRGLLIPDTREPPISTSIELEQSRHAVSGRITTAAPLTGEGRLVAGQRRGYECSFKSDIGAGRVLAFTGFCLSRTVEGVYTLHYPDGTARQGELRLSRVEPKTASLPTETTTSEQPTDSARRTTACLSVRSACLAACPRGDYNAEFMCSNRCRQKFAACKAAGAAAMP